ncbi:MAG: type I restriction endonuclease [Planctomycetota bacterium]
MDLLNKLQKLGERAVQLVAHVETEEATKTALVLPFLQELGYDIFDPSEVIPEFTADVGIKRGEKVDYAVCREGKPAILIECKPHGAKLDRYSSQLYRYFSVTDARIAILTDGIDYRFYSDIAAPNKLDDDPFLSLNIVNPKVGAAKQVAKLTKTGFDLEGLLASAEDLQYISKVRYRFASELSSPSDALVRLFVDDVYAGRFTQQAVERFREIVRTAMRSHITESVDARLRSALDANTSDESATEQEQTDAESTESDLETTAEELEGLYAIKAILHGTVEPDRIVPRDVRSYFGINLDDNNRKPICRLWFNGRRKYVGVFDAKKIETRLVVNGPTDLFQHSEAIRTSAGFALGSPANTTK